jgi:site-specific recombinase XerD
MLYRYCRKFLKYCRFADFSDRSIQALEIRLGKFRSFVRTRKLKSIKDIKYLQLAAFTAGFNHPSVHVRKSRVFTLWQFYHFLSLHGYAKNITKNFPTPKSKRPYLTLTWKQMIRLVCHFESDSILYACLPDYQPSSSFSNNIKRISQLRILRASPSPTKWTLSERLIL